MYAPLVCPPFSKRSGGAAFLATYMDDPTFGCTEELAAEVINWLIEEGPKEGCVLNLTKTVVWAPCRMANIEPTPESEKLPSKIVCVKENGVKLLGCPLGSPAFSLAFVRKVLAAKVLPLFKKLSDVKDLGPSLPSSSALAFPPP